MTHRILKTALLFFSLLLVLVFAVDIPFMAIKKDNPLSGIAYWLSESGGKCGTALILVVTCLFYTRFMPGAGQKFKVFSFTLVKLLLVIGAMAWINEYVIKLALKRPRPSHEYVLSRSVVDWAMDEFYAQDVAERKETLERTLENNAASFAHVHPKILAHWTVETGYSFPSGHSFNTFLLAFILSFSLRYSRSKTGNMWYWIPLFWAMLVAASRVAIGAHTAWDVSFGALTGIGIAFILMHYNLLRRNLLHRDHEKIFTR